MGSEDVEALTEQRRRERWGLLNGARRLTALDKVRTCGLATVTGTGAPTLRIGEQGAGYAGLATCGSVWACPNCAAKIANRRADELAAVLLAVFLAGGCAYLVTLTMRHDRFHGLAELWAANSAGWSAVTSGRQWAEDSAELLGWARAVEVTHSKRSGWHVHVHALLCFSGEVDEDTAQGIAMRGWLRWNRALGRKGFDSTPVRGVDARRVDAGSGGAAGEYLAKAGREMTGAYAKDAKGGGRTPFALLRAAVEDFDADARDAWNEYEAASHGRKQLTWSTGRRDLRAFAGLGREQTDEEIAEEETGGDDTLAPSTDTWDVITAHGWQAELLNAANREGTPGATAWLDARGLDWTLVERSRWRQRQRLRSPQIRQEAREVLVGAS